MAGKNHPVKPTTFGGMRFFRALNRFFFHLAFFFTGWSQFGNMCEQAARPPTKASVRHSAISKCLTPPRGPEIFWRPPTAADDR